MRYLPYWNEKIETMPLPRLQQLQARKLRKQIAYLTKSSPFYRRKFKEAGITASDIRTLVDLTKLPFTTKDELRESQIKSPPLGEQVAVPMEKVIRLHSSSGTTGRPSYVGITKRDRKSWIEMVARCYWSEGVRPSSIVIMGFGIGMFVGGLPLANAIEEIGATFVPVGTGASDRLITSIQHLKADIITCTPSYASYLADYAKDKMGIDPRTLGIKRILCGAEPGGGVTGIRERIEEQWGAVVTEATGNADVVTVYAAECPQRTGNHFLAGDFVIPEIIDPDTGESLPIEDGVEGEIVFTHIDRDCVPLVRFRSRDRVVVWTRPCRCRRSGFRLRIIGRTDDMLILRGVNVFPSAIKDVVSQMRPKTTGEIQVLLEQPGPRVEPPLKIQAEYGVGVEDLQALKKEVEENLKNKLIFSPDVELVPAGSLPRFEMKAKLIRKLYEE